MSTLDILILIVLLIGMIKGWMSGFFRQATSTAGLLIGLVLAAMLYTAAGDWLAPHIGVNTGVAYALAFILIWIGVPVALSVVAYVLTKAAEILCLGGINRLGGAILGGLKYALLFSCLLNVMVRLHFMQEPGQSTHLYKPLSALSGVFFDFCSKHVHEAAEESIKHIS